EGDAMRRRNLSIIAILTVVVGLLFVAGRGGSRPGEGPDAKAEKKPSVKPLRISLFPYVPDQQLTRKVVAERWKKRHPDVRLEFVGLKQFDSYKQDPPDDLDVFEFDSILLDHFVRTNAISPINPSDVKDAEDYLTFAWKGCMVNG